MASELTKDFTHIRAAIREAKDKFLDTPKVWPNLLKELEEALQTIDSLTAENNRLRINSRKACQVLVEAVGADGPCDVDQAAARAVSQLVACDDQIQTERAALRRERAEKDELLASMESVRIAARNRNPKGPTLLDFMACWNEQYEKQLAARASEVERLRERLEKSLNELSAEAKTIERAIDSDDYGGDLDACELEAGVLWHCIRKVCAALAQQEPTK